MRAVVSASGEVAFQSGVRLVSVFIASNPSGTVFVPGVCQFPDTTTRVPNLKLFNEWLPDQSSRGYGHLFAAFGFMRGTSIPIGNGIYADNFDSFNLWLLN